MKTCLSGNGFVVNTGDPYDCSPDEAGRLIAAGFAEADDQAAVELPTRDLTKADPPRRGRPPKPKPAPPPAGAPATDPPAADAPAGADAPPA